MTFIFYCLLKYNEWMTFYVLIEITNDIGQKIYTGTNSGFSCKKGLQKYLQSFCTSDNSFYA